MLEKEKRKTKRELKKKQREEEQKVKAAKRAAEREAAKAKREAAKAAKEAARVEKDKEKSLSGTKRRNPSDPRVSKRSRGDAEAGEDADNCCVCFGSYLEGIDTGREWIQCSCNRWLHEDCIDDNVNGKLCPLC